NYAKPSNFQKFTWNAVRKGCIFRYYCRMRVALICFLSVRDYYIHGELITMKQSQLIKNFNFSFAVIFVVKELFFFPKLTVRRAKAVLPASFGY
ncbi:hypothetical protein, partial [Leptospira sp. id769339]|uniref:hypothetical protein n=1 Tax=Leptospira sp. id769339 TaxID=2864221 RepID=UPI00214C24DC